MVPPGPTRAGAPRSRALRGLVAGLLAAAAALAPLSACTPARTKIDCDQSLTDKHYDDVIKRCEDPYLVASAYLGKAGFDMFALINSTAPEGKVAGLLGLTAANVNEKRLLINQAIEAVKAPDGGNQAFTLLLASFLGLAVTTEQFLDNGAGGQAALDDVLAQSEIDAALGLNAPTVPTLTVVGSTSPAYFSIVTGGAPYTADCTADTSPGKCGGAATAVYDDADGSGIIPAGAGASPNQTAVQTAIGTGAVTASGYAVQITDLILPFSVSAATQEPVTTFLSGTNPDGTFNIGLGGYLRYLQVADAELARSSGSSGGTDVTAQVDAIVSKFDNGAPATCPSVAALNAAPTFYLDMMDSLMTIYSQAVGTSRAPAGAGPYTAYNFVDQALFDPSVSALFPAWPAGAYAFPAGVRYRVLYPKSAGLGAFTSTEATPRVDQAHAAFISQFENIPLFSRAGSPSGDDRVNILEVLCSAD